MPSDVRFAEIRKILEQNGWTLVRVRGSHHHFGGEGRPTFRVPVHHGKVKWVYARQLEKAIKEVREKEGGARD